MSYTPDFTRDLETVFDLDSYTLKVEGQIDVSLADCVLTTPVETKELEPSAGQVPQMDQLIVWPKYRSPTKPTLGSVLVDSDGTYWTILAISHTQHVDCWEAQCRNLSVLPTVANQAIFLKAVYGKGRANEAKATWVGLFSGQSPPTEADTITARIQPSTEDAMIRFGAEWTNDTYRVVLSQQLAVPLVGGNYRIQDENGNRYRIMQYVTEQRLDRLPVCIVIRVHEGSEYFAAGRPAPLAPPTFPSP